MYFGIEWMARLSFENVLSPVVAHVGNAVFANAIILNLCSFTCSPGIMLLIFERTPSHVPLQILSIEDGTVLKTFHHLLHKNKKVDFIEQFNEKLLVKQENENLQILDVRMFSDLFYMYCLFMTFVKYLRENMGALEFHSLQCLYT